MMRSLLSLVVFLAALTGARPQETERPGAVVGVVRYTGQVPAPQKIITSDGAVLQHSDLVVDPKTEGLRHVAVYLQDAAPQPLAKNAKPVVIDQRDMIFIPRVVVAQEGQTVRFDNNDLCNHAVQSATTTVENLFNVLTPQGQPFDFKFKAQKSPVQIGCPIHAWMRAWVYVLPHPFAAVTDAQGQFKIEGIATGKYTLLVTHPDTGLREARIVEVAAGKKTLIEVEWRKSTK